MRTGNVAPTIGRFKKASTKPTKTTYMQDKLAKLAKTCPAQRPQVQGVTHQPLRIETNSKATSHPIKKETYSTKLHVSAKAKQLAAQHKPQAKPHGPTFVLKTVIKDAVSPAWDEDQVKAWKAHNKANPTHQIHY